MVLKLFAEGTSTGLTQLLDGTAFSSKPLQKTSPLTLLEQQNTANQMSSY